MPKLAKTAVLLLPPLAALAVLGWTVQRAMQAGPVQSETRGAGAVSVALPGIRPTAPLPAIAGPEDRTRPLVVIDPGHGGFDPGAIFAGEDESLSREKDAALALALDLRAALLALGGVRVALTRADDRFIGLRDRPGIGRRLGADLFVSIHADSAPEGVAATARGASVYVLSASGSSAAATRFAIRENRSGLAPGVSADPADGEVGAILLDLSQREANAGSLDAARMVLRELDGAVPLHSRHVQAAALAVLEAPDMPSILLEAGYLSNAEDRRALADGKTRQTLAAATARAIRVFLAKQAVD